MTFNLRSTQTMQSYVFMRKWAYFEYDHINNRFYFVSSAIKYQNFLTIEQSHSRPSDTVQKSPCLDVPALTNGTPCILLSTYKHITRLRDVQQPVAVTVNAATK